MISVYAGFNSLDRTTRAEQVDVEGWSGERSGKGGGPTIVVVALRADFYAHCANYPQLRQALSQQQEYIGSMSGEELRRAIETPAKRGGWELEPGLVEVLLQDLQGEPGALPLLSHALLETWERRRGRTLTMSGYSATGGVRGAIAETAEAVFQDQLNPAQRELARHIFLQLTELNKDDSLPDTRRRVALSELILNPEEGAAVRQVLTQLADARLITTERETVEVAHEALIREWPTLREWLAEDREGLRLHRRLTEAAHEWEQSGRNESELYHGARLAQAQEWAAIHMGSLNMLEREFLDTSRAWAEREAAERENQRQRELDAARTLAETEKALAEEQKHYANRLRDRNRLIAGAGVMALLLAILAALFGLQSRQHAARAESEKQLAISRELALAGVNSLENDPELSILLALQALSVTYTSEAERALHRAVQASRVKFSIHGYCYNLDYSPDGKRLALARSDGEVIVLDTTNGQHLLSFEAHAPTYWFLVYSPDSTRIATTGKDYTIMVWDANTGQELLHLAGHTDEIYAIAFSLDGARIATSSLDTAVKVWNAQTGQELFTLTDHTAPVHSIAFSPDGARLITRSEDSTVKISDAETGQVLVTPQEDGSWATVYSRDGSRYANSDGRMLWIREAPSGQELFALSLDAPSQYDFSTDGKRLVVANLNGMIKILDATTAEELLSTFNSRGNHFIEFSPDDKHIAAIDRDGMVRVFDISPEGSRV
jgi:DNA-binding beta-propeller fold protein YncE